MNPCVDYCYARFGKEYREECDNVCDYAKAVKKAKELEEELKVWQRRVDNQAKEIDRLTAQRDDYFLAAKDMEKKLGLEKDGWLKLSGQEMIDAILEAEGRDRFVASLLSRYVALDYDKAFELLKTATTLARRAADRLAAKENAAHVAAERLINTRNLERGRALFAAMVPICMVLFPQGNSKGYSAAQKQYFKEFADMMADPECFSWEKDGNWAKAMGYEKYLERVEKEAAQSENTGA